MSYRESIEEQKKEKLATAQKKQKELENQLQLSQGEYKLHANIKPLTKINISSLEHQLAYLDYLDIKIAEQKNAVLNNSLKVELARSKVVEAMKDKKIIEKLRDKQENIYYQEIEKIEAMNLNEVALRMFTEQKR